ncbi:MAG TPA: hypothetical protein VGV86_16560, partial [Acidimicrobiales bacterium]|nr:hypothetical protein [Acidimicrobiales bacterium]
VLYFAVEGQPPFSGNDSAAILEAVASDPPRPAERAGSLGRVLELTLQKDPNERPSADELRTLLEVAAGDLAHQPAPEPSPDSDDGTSIWAPMELDLRPAEESSATTDGELPVIGFSEPVEDSAEAAAEPAEPAEELPPPPPLPPRVALARMFSPDPGTPPALFTPEEEHREPAPPWPVPRRRSTWTVVICAAVMLVLVAILFTNGREIFTDEGRTARIIASVDWSEYTDPATGFRIDFPTDWRVSREGNYTDFRHPDSAAALRVVVQDSNSRSAEAGWLELERRFKAEQQSYSRIRLEPTRFRGFSAAEWEFTYTKADIQLRNFDLGVVTGDKAFTLNFEARAGNWSVVEAFMDRFQSSFRPPPT